MNLVKTGGTNANVDKDFASYRVGKKPRRPKAGTVKIVGNKKRSMKRG